MAHPPSPTSFSCNLTIDVTTTPNKLPPKQPQIFGGKTQPPFLGGGGGIILMSKHKMMHVCVHPPIILRGQRGGGSTNKSIA